MQIYVGVVYIQYVYLLGMKFLSVLMARYLELVKDGSTMAAVRYQDIIADP